jgi:hypothetical protein
MTTSLPKEDLTAYRERLAAAYAAVEAVKTGIDFARDAVEEARDEARSLFGTPEATSAFNNPLADLSLASRATDDALNGLPAIDEGGANEEEDSKSA